MTSLIQWSVGYVFRCWVCSKDDMTNYFSPFNPILAQNFVIMRCIGDLNGIFFVIVNSGPQSSVPTSLVDLEPTGKKLIMDSPIRLNRIKISSKLFERDMNLLTPSNCHRKQGAMQEIPLRKQTELFHYYRG